MREEGGRWSTGNGFLEGSGPPGIVYAGRRMGPGDFHVTARLTIRRLARSAASFVVDGNSHFGFEGATGRPFLSGPFFAGVKPPEAPAGLVREGVRFRWEMVREKDDTTFRIDGKEVLRVHSRAMRAGMVGFRPWRSKMQISEFSSTGATGPLPAPRTQPTGYTIPTVDLSKQTWRQVVVERIPDRYLGHPTTVLLRDNRTILCTYPLGHGGPAAVLKRSTDGGLTWSERLPVPASWATATNCPCIHRLTGPGGVERLFVFEGVGAMRQSVSLDEGETWTPFEANGLHCIVAPITIVPIARGRLLAMYHRGQGDKDRPPLTLWQSLSADGGLTWGPERMIAEMDAADPCEPAVIRSPDGKQLAAVIRENQRRYNSLLIVSHDEGETWSKPVELPASLTGDRHMPRYAHDGRLVMTFRDQAEESPTRGDFVAWVGTYDDLVNLREGQYRVWLLDAARKGDLGYPGLELLPDGTFVTTTYAQLAEGEKNSVVSIHFSLEEIDERAAAAPPHVEVFPSGEGGYHTYRIPALIVSAKGTLLAFSEGRKGSSSDTGDIDLFLRRSFDNGATWEPARVIADDGPNTIGNPCPVVDRDTGTIWLLLTHNLGEDTEPQIMARTGKGTRTVWVMKSTDDGATWTKPVEITATTKDPGWTWYATGPGVGIQTRGGRLVIPCDHAVASTGAWRSHAIYSDDHGTTWRLGGVLGEPTNECQVAELSDGSLLMNMRSYHGKSRRAIAFSKDGGLTWSPETLDPALVEPICQASLARLPDGRLLFSNPADPEKRNKMTIRLSSDEGKTWPVARLLWAGTSMYSCLAPLPDGSIGNLYERVAGGRYTISYARFGLEWLANGSQ